MTADVGHDRTARLARNTTRPWALAERSEPRVVDVARKKDDGLLDGTGAALLRNRPNGDLGGGGLDDQHLAAQLLGQVLVRVEPDRGIDLRLAGSAADSAS